MYKIDKVLCQIDYAVYKVNKSFDSGGLKTIYD